MPAEAAGLPADRRAFLKTAVTVLSTALVRTPRGFGATPLEPPIVLGVGPHLFIDDFLVASSRQLTRTVHPPERLADPVLDRGRFGPTQPYASVLRDPTISGYRLWYNRGSAIWHVKSDDGIAWRDPRVSWDLPRAYGCGLIDDVGAMRTFPDASSWRTGDPLAPSTTLRRTTRACMWAFRRTV